MVSGGVLMNRLRLCFLSLSLPITVVWLGGVGEKVVEMRERMSQSVSIISRKFFFAKLTPFVLIVN